MLTLKNKLIIVNGAFDTGKGLTRKFLSNHSKILFKDYSKIQLTIPDKNLNPQENDFRDFLPKEKINNIEYILLYFFGYQHAAAISINDVKWIFTFRDPRVGWLVSEHKKDCGCEFHQVNLDEYVDIYMEKFNHCMKFKCLFIKFEDVLLDPFKKYSELCRNLNIEMEPNSMPKFEVFNKYITKFDVTKIVKFYNDVNNHALNIITEKTKKSYRFF